MKQYTLRTIFIILASVIIASLVHADPGDLDTTFGPDQNGKVTTDITIRDDVVRDLVVQEDGKLVVVGVTNSNGIVAALVLVRYNTNGSQDETFGSNGIVLTQFSGGIDEGYAVALQADGKIVAAGVSAAGTPDPEIALARYHPADGSLDTTFGTGGKVTTSVSSSGDAAYDVAVQPDGSIVVAGATNTKITDTRFIVARYTGDGSLDDTFGPGDNGYAITNFSATNDTAYAVALQPDDDKIVVAGITDEGGQNPDFALARYNIDGSLDTALGSDGQITTDLSNYGNDGAFALALQGDGKIIAGGIANWGSPTAQGGDFGLVRYLTDGSLDADFGTDGIVITSFSFNDDMARGLVLQADGKILAGGFSGYGLNSAEFALACYLEDGTLDDTFGSDGMVTTDFTVFDDGAFGLALQQDGKIVLVGASALSSTSSDFALARYFSTLPAITVTTPAANAERVSPDTDITATFSSSQPMDASTITTASFTLQHGAVTIDGEVSFHGGAATATLRPSESLDYETVYTATVTTEVADQGGNHIPSDYTWTFTTKEESSSSGGGCSCFITTGTF